MGELATAEGMGRIYTLGGSPFHVVDFARRTVRQDHYLMRLMRKTGADKAVPMDNEHSSVFVMRVQSLLIDSGLTPEMLGGYLIPVGKTERDWTPAMAKQTAEHVGQCNSPEDRELVQDLCVEVAFGFFKQGLEQWTRSPSSFELLRKRAQENPNVQPVDLTKETSPA
jgi:hypothetical protein